MQLKDLNAFIQEIEKKIPSICLIISKEDVSASIFLKKWRGKVIKLDGLSFSLDYFLQEAENLALFPEPLLFYIQNAEKLKDREKKLLASHLQNPRGNHFLLSSASALSFFPKTGMVLQLAEEKPWQARKRVEEWLRREYSNLKMPIIKCLIDTVGLDQNALSQEIEKLLLYKFPEKEITIKDIEEVVAPQNSATLWDLGEALFQKNSSLALVKGHALLDSGTSLFTLLAQLRTQVRTLLDMVQLVEAEGITALQRVYPYLRGGILEKKIEEIKNNSAEELQRNLALIFQYELKAKNSNVDPSLLLETLLIKMNYDLISTP